MSADMILAIVFGVATVTILVWIIVSGEKDRK
jgi:hypothetical protein